MNREEQKPEDFLEREVKEEIKDFVAKIEEEPLCNAYHEQVVPKLEEVINPCLPSTLLLPTQNEYMSDTLSFQISSNDSKRPLQNTYQKQKFGTEFAAESHNKAPIVYRIPTLNKNSVSKQRIAQFILNNDSSQKQTFDDYFSRRNREKKLTNDSSRFNSLCKWCAVCKHKNHRKMVSSVSIEEDKWIIMIGSVLRGEQSLANVQLFMFANRNIMNIFVCFFHFSEVYNEICKVLHITNSTEIASCSLSLIQMYIPTMNDLIPHLTPLQFRTNFNNFALRNKNLIEMAVSVRLNLEDYQIPNDFLQLEIKQEDVKEKPMDEYFDQTEPSINASEQQSSAQIFQNQMPQVEIQSITGLTDDGPLARKMKTKHCSVCFQSKQIDLLSQLSKENEKLLIMVGCILRGEYTHEEAKLFLTGTKRYLVCYSHFPETIDEIYKVLNIQSLRELYSCSSDSIQHVMNIINALSPQYTTSDFYSILNCFISSMDMRLKRRNWRMK